MANRASDLFFPPEFICFTTRDYALANHQSIPSASRSLTRLTHRKILTRVSKGIWANTKHPSFSPLACVPLLLGREQGYVSFLTALHRQGALSQIPPTIQVATTGHSRKRQTPIGVFEFFQLKPQMMTEGVDWAEAKLPYRMASAEKALIDAFYISTRKTNRFSILPEMDSEFRFNRKLLSVLLKKQVKDRRIRVGVERRVGELFHRPRTVNYFRR